MRKNFKHGKWVRATGIPHADIAKYVDKKTGKEIDDKKSSRARISDTTMEFKKPKKSRGPSGGRQAGRTKLRGGGRTNLLEELGRVEAEPSNRNRRAEVSRVHRELNRGYATGGRISVKKKRVGPETWTETHKYKKPYGRAKTVTDSRKGHAKGGRSGYKSGGAVLKGKKVGIQIK